MADPGELAAKALQKNFSKFGKMRKYCLYKSLGNPAYSNQEVVENSQGTANLYIIFGEFSYTQKQASETKQEGERILSNDKNAIFPALDLPFSPYVDDEIIDEDGVCWVVIARSNDPLPIHYELHVRPC